MPTISDMHSKIDWAKCKMEDAVKKGNLQDAQKFQEISAAYNSAAMRIVRERGNR